MYIYIYIYERFTILININKGISITLILQKNLSFPSSPAVVEFFEQEAGGAFALHNPLLRQNS